MFMVQPDSSGAPRSNPRLMVRARRRLVASAAMPVGAVVLMIAAPWSAGVIASAVEGSCSAGWTRALSASPYPTSIRPAATRGIATSGHLGFRLAGLLTVDAVKRHITLGGRRTACCNRHIPYGMRILQRLREGKGTRAAGPACRNGTIAARGWKGAR
jgi:hypothetical protein